MEKCFFDSQLTHSNLKCLSKIFIKEAFGKKCLQPDSTLFSNLIPSCTHRVITPSCMANNITGVPPSEANAKQRMQNIVKRRRLVELVRAQAQEISVLTTEAERLRMRTFPALVQVD